MKSALCSNTLLFMTAGTFLFAPPLARSQSDRAAVGDLVEFVSGLGPTLAEVVVAPDASGYVQIALPTGKQIPVNTAKLRLVQKAGTPNAAMQPGESVSWVSGHIKEKGTVVKVNGAWCQVKTPSATTVGWVECSELAMPGQPPAKSEKPKQATAKMPALPGNWENADGTVKVEFQSASKCFISFGPISEACAYRQSAQAVTVTFDGEDLVLAPNDDGSLSSADPNATMPIRLKRK